MPQGWQGPDDNPPTPETLRRFPSEPGGEDLESPPEAEFNTPATIIQSSSPARHELLPDSESEGAPDPSSGAGKGSGSGSASGGSFVEPGVIEVEASQIVFGKYLVLEPLGEGGMGEVWLVKDVELDVKRALKMITQRRAFDSNARARFRREARAMARFTHPNVVAVHDSRLDRHDIAYIVMEYVAGRSLEKVLGTGGPMPLDWTLDVLTQLCDALQEAHDHGIIHRDLKPSNLILVPTATGRELLKVLDFGIAKILQVEDGANDAMTLVGDFMGTPPYASPEQAAGLVQPSNDIYSVGVILYEFLTGRRPFLGKRAEMIANTMLTPPPPFAGANPEAKVPAEIERVVMRCLAKMPEDRPQTARELLEEFKAAMPKGLAGAPRPSPPKPPLDRRRFLIGGSIAAAAVVLGFAATKLPLSSRGTGTPPGKPHEPPKPPAAEIVREGRPFRLWNGRVYLPEGYKAANPKDLDGAGYPKALVRLDGVRFVRIPGGQFEMGAQGDEDGDGTNRPARSVIVPGFYIQEHEVTNGELLEHSRRFPDGVNDLAAPESWRTWHDELSHTLGPELAARHPARQVSWRLAADFARRHGGSLPTEAQWEYAARSGETSHVLVWDRDDEQNIPRVNQANLLREVRNGVRTSEVGAYSNDKTRQGVMDMAGNVREWCRDPWIAYDAMSHEGPPRLPDNPPLETEVVVRGGSFETDFDSRYVTRRGKPIRLADGPPRDVGFRMVIECPEAGPNLR